MVSYAKRADGLDATIRLYTLEEYLDELGGSPQGLIELDRADKYADYREGLLDREEIEEPGEFRFVGAATVEGPDEETDDQEVAKDLLGLGDVGDGWAFAPAVDSSAFGGVVEGTVFLLRRWPPDTPVEVLARLRGRL